MKLSRFKGEAFVFPPILLRWGRIIPFSIIEIEIFSENFLFLLFSKAPFTT